uniref:3-beta hydroxysteroid dehydrogenase/isomerase domain-containing protein n=1 Tax=Acrobeloides nanus TaxID=290746 RepID=A0A914BXA2_9BILA
MMNANKSNIRYTVRGTVRSLKNPEKVQPLRDLKFAQERLELVEADLLAADKWPKAVDSCDYVLHVASPLPLVGDENTIKTAVDGTINVLRACSTCHSVKKVVLTSSVAAINQRAAWDFVESIPNGDNHFKLTCLHPGYIVGPLLTIVPPTSAEIIKRILNHEMPGLPEIDTTIVDVRDIAKAHILAMENPKSDGERIMTVYHKNYWFRDIALILDKEFGPQGYCIPKRNLPYFMLWIVSFFDSTVKDLLGLVGVEHKIDNSKARNLLGMEFIHPEKSIVDMGYSLIEKGIVPKKSGYKPRTRL